MATTAANAGSGNGSGSGSGLASFEKELICSICTEVLYQPLTILNCLHTFCGSCLKEWFSHQHRKASSSRSSSSTANPYSCPTCRSEVVDVQHNATVSNLLELFLAANPGRDRSPEEKDEMNEIYKPDGTRPGEKILPKVERRRERRHRREHSEAARERQMVEEARLRSLRELDNASSSSSATGLLPPRGDRNRSASADRDERRQRRRERERQREDPAALAIPYASNHQQPEDAQDAASPPVSSPRHPDAIEARQREQRMSHQASLRSLVSASESGTGTGTGTGDSLDEARIMQEILDEGLLGDIDVDTLTEAEQDMLAERIAELYRQRHSPRSMPNSPPQSSRHMTNTSPNSLQIQQRQQRDWQQRSSSAQPSAQDPATTPASEARARAYASRPQQMPPTSIVRSNSQGSSVTIHHRRQNSDHSQQARAVGRSRQSSSERPLTSSSTSNLVEGRRPSNNTSRVNTDPVRFTSASDAWLQAGGEDRRSRLQNGASPARSPRNAQTMPLNVSSAPEADRDNGTTFPELDSTVAPISSSSVSNTYEEPSVTCFRCNKADIQYEISRHCRVCRVDLCMKCYREAKGCKHWYGFGHAADINFENSKMTNEDTERPHVLIGRQYRKPAASAVTATRLSNRQQEPLPKTTTSNPDDRLQEGHFCDRCDTFANSQFWLCDTCNDGEWGFCKQCVQTHHCCTHPLLPVAYVPHTQSLLHPLQSLHLNHAPTASLHPANTTNSRPTTPNSTTSNHHSRHNSGYDYLSINVNCDMCHQIIFPSSPRYHCPFHQTDYDICTSCYSSFVQHSRMRRDGYSSSDVVAGWRKCPQGHRMIILAFEPDTTTEDNNNDSGTRRVIKADLVGGWKTTEPDIRLWNQQHNIYTSPPTSPPPTSSTRSNTGTWTWTDSPSGPRKTRSRTSTLSPSNTITPHGIPRFPPDAGFGKRGLAIFPYWPDDGPEGEGELRLPRGAEVAEIEDVNGDWWSGVYAGDIGVFPYGYVRELR